MLRTHVAATNLLAVQQNVVRSAGIAVSSLAEFVVVDFAITLNRLLLATEAVVVDVAEKSSPPSMSIKAFPVADMSTEAAVQLAMHRRPWVAQHESPDASQASTRWLTPVARMRMAG